MVFSFFKKPPQKMPERRAAKPRAQTPESVPPPNVAEATPASLAAPLPNLEFANSKPPAAAAPTAKAAPAAKPVAPVRSVIDPNLAKDDFDDAEFMESDVMGIDVDQDIDPVQADVEHVVVLFANGQEAAARSLLETLIRAYPGEDGKRFWLLLLDLLQCVGDHAAFDELALEFAETWETSPSSWRRTDLVAERKNNNQRRLVLQGVLTSENAESLTELAELLARGLPVVVECGRLIGCDDEVAGQLAAILRQARRDGGAVMLKEVDGFLTRLNERLPAGDAGHESAWALLLELLQRHGAEEQFEERAVDYAVTFELSPPSWEGAPPPMVEPEEEADEPLPAGDVYYLEGDLKNRRFDELIEVLDDHELPIVDFSGVRSMDFFSAGQLVNRIAPYKARGRDILIRSPNHLVAELMAVVGLNRQARIIVPKS